MKVALENLTRFYRRFDADTWRRAAAVYHPQAVFSDPVHRIEGLARIEDYFRDMAADLISCEFEFTHTVTEQDQAFLRWIMRFRHPRLKRGALIEMPGMTRVRVVDGLVIEHEDCYDMGAMVYEQLPLLGRLVRWLRTRLGESPSESIGPLPAGRS